MFPSRNSGYIVRKFARKYCSEEWWWRRIVFSAVTVSKA
jgi:hypothetical protein